MQIETRLLERSSTAVANFNARLPKSQSDLTRESLTDPYRFDFLSLADKAQERASELKGDKFRPEHLGQPGFYLAAMDRQVRIEHDNPLTKKTGNAVMLFT